MNQDKKTARREFLKKAIVTTAYSSIAGRYFVGTLVADVRPAAANEGTLNIAIADYPALQQDFGSIRLVLSPLSQNVPRNRDFYPVMINRENEETYHALKAICNHQNCSPRPFNGSAAVCPCHESRFDIDGSLLGGRATMDMPAYETEFDRNKGILRVQVPGLGFDVQGGVISDPNRFHLSFQSETLLTYEVVTRTSLDDEWMTTAFSTTESGTADRTILIGNGRELNAYVDRTNPAAFYAVKLRTIEL